MTDTMKEVLVLHLSLLHVLIQRIQDYILKCLPRTFWEIALYVELPPSELIVEIHYCKWHIAHGIRSATISPQKMCKLSKLFCSPTENTDYYYMKQVKQSAIVSMHRCLNLSACPKTKIQPVDFLINVMQFKLWHSTIWLFVQIFLQFSKRRERAMQVVKF